VRIEFNMKGSAAQAIHRNRESLVYVKLPTEFEEKFGDRYRTVRDYYLPRKGLVVIQDVSPFVPELVTAGLRLARPKTSEPKMAQRKLTSNDQDAKSKQPALIHPSDAVAPTLFSDLLRLTSEPGSWIPMELLRRFMSSHA
jgi:hypothetical protein